MNPEGNPSAGVSSNEKAGDVKNVTEANNEKGILAQTKEKARNLGKALKARFSGNRKEGLESLASGAALSETDGTPKPESDDLTQHRAELAALKKPKLTFLPGGGARQLAYEQQRAELQARYAEKVAASRQTTPENTSMKQLKEASERTKAPQEIASKAAEGETSLTPQERDELRELQLRDRANSSDLDSDPAALARYEELTYRALTETLNAGGMDSPLSIPETPVVGIESSGGGQTEELPLVTDSLQREQNKNVQDLIKAMKLTGLNLANIQQHTELFRVDSRDFALLSQLDRGSSDEILGNVDDPVLRGIRERLLADDPKNPDARYGVTKNSINRAIEATATGFRAKSYLEHFSQMGGSGLAEALKMDRDKLQAAGGVDGDLAEAKQRMVTMGGMTVNAQEADIMLRMLENAQTSAESTLAAQAATRSDKIALVPA